MRAGQLAVFCLVLAPVLWGGNFVIAKLAVTDIHAAWLNAFRWLIAGLFVVPFAWQQLVEERQALIQSGGRLAILACLGIVGFNTTLYIALQSVPASIAAIGFATTPLIILLLLAIIDMRTPALTLILACIASLTGVYLVLLEGLSICSGGQCIQPEHMLLVFAAALIWAAYCIALKRLPVPASAMSVFAAKILIGIAVQVPITFMLFDMPVASAFTNETLLYLAYLGIGASAIAFLAWSFALRVVDAGRASIYLNLVPISSMFLGIAFLGERMDSVQLSGAALVFLGLIIAQTQPAQTAPR